MSPSSVAREAINRVQIMQLATSRADKPWVVTVHFYADDDFNIYWISRADRRHSEELRANPNVAATILVHENTADENWVTAITISGQAEELSKLDDTIAQAYLAKLGKNPEEVQGAAKGDGPAKFYRLKSSQIILFDTKNFPENPRQEVQL